MRIRFYNARILSMQNQTEPDVFDGEVWIENDKIVYCGDAKGLEELGDLVRGHFDQEINCEGNLLMPGFKNAHTHSAMTFLRSSADDYPLDRWLNEQVFPYEAKLQPDDIYTLSKLAILEYLTSGMTACMEMYMEPESIQKAASEMGFRMVQVSCTSNFAQSPALMEKWYDELNHKDDLTSYQLGFHAEYTSSEELVEQYAALAHKFKAPVFAHVSETESEVQACIDRYGKTPVKFLADKGVFDFGGAGYHLVHTNEEDRQIMLDKHIAVVTNPGSNTKLASGIAPLAEYLRLGIPVAIGTDGPASNNCLDMFREMFLATGLNKLHLHDASAVPAYEVLKMATTNGARIMTRPDTDCLEAGKKADMIMIDLDQPNMQPFNHIAHNVVYSGSKMNVKMTMVNGKILYDRFDGHMNFHVGEDVHDIYRDCNTVTNRLLGK